MNRQIKERDTNEEVAKLAREIESQLKRGEIGSIHRVSKEETKLLQLYRQLRGPRGKILTASIAIAVLVVFLFGFGVFGNSPVGRENEGPENLSLSKTKMRNYLAPEDWSKAGKDEIQELIEMYEALPEDQRGKGKEFSFFVMDGETVVTEVFDVGGGWFQFTTITPQRLGDHVPEGYPKEALEGTGEMVNMHIKQIRVNLEGEEEVLREHNLELFDGLPASLSLFTRTSHTDFNMESKLVSDGIHLDGTVFSPKDFDQGISP